MPRTAAKPITITHADASASILAHVESRSLVQSSWHGRAADGRDIACLLGSMHPKVQSAADCNGDLMPMWMAELTVSLFDGIAPNQVYPLAERYGRLIARWHVLTDTAWNDLLKRFLMRVIDDAVDAVRPVAEGKPYWAQVAAACEQSKNAILSGDPAAARGAESAASVAAWAAANAAASAASAARDAAWAAASAAASAAAWAAERAARGAACAAASAARGAASAACAAASAARGAYDKLFVSLLDQIEAEIIKAGG